LREKAGRVRPWFNFPSWPLRAKLAALLLVASLLPLAIAAIIDIRGARKQLVATTSALLAARGDQLSEQLDTFHRGYQRSANRFAHLPDVTEFFQNRRGRSRPARPADACGVGGVAG